MIAHSGNKQYKCPNCDKTFRRKGILKKHLASHRREKGSSSSLEKRLLLPKITKNEKNTGISRFNEEDKKENIKPRITPNLGLIIPNSMNNLQIGPIQMGGISGNSAFSEFPIFFPDNNQPKSNIFFQEAFEEYPADLYGKRFESSRVSSESDIFQSFDTQSQISNSNNKYNNNDNENNYLFSYKNELMNEYENNENQLEDLLIEKFLKSPDENLTHNYAFTHDIFKGSSFKENPPFIPMI